MPKLVNIQGQRFGHLEALNRLPKSKNGSVVWLCKCHVCGTTNKELSYRDLVWDNYKSCGCNWHTPRSAVGEVGFRYLYKKYELAALERGHEFNLTAEQFRILTQANCHYCGVEPRQITRSSGRATSKYLEHSKYIYNGVDRKNNKRGYVEDNCVSCCGICNRAKSSLSYDVFMSYIDRIRIYPTTQR